MLIFHTHLCRYFQIILTGTPEERGIAQWRKLYGEQSKETTKELLSCYNIPFIQGWIERTTWLKYLPFSPTFEGWNVCRRKKGMY